MAEFSNQAGIQGDTFGIGGPAPAVGVVVKNAAGIAQTRNTADTLFADAYVGLLRANDPLVGLNDTGAVIGNGKVRHGAGVQSYGLGGIAIGNARGVGASDLQTDRSAATQVASGARSLVAGRNNTASGADSVALGSDCTATAAGAIAAGFSADATAANAVAMGDQALASAAAAVAFGELTVASGPAAFATGRRTIASGSAAAAFGQDTRATADYSTAFGQASVADAQGMISISGGFIATIGDSQTCLVTWGVATAAAALTTMGLDGTAAGPELTLPASSAYSFEILVTAEVAGATAGKVWTIVGGIRRPGAGLAVFIGGVAPVAAVVATDGALAAATVVVTAPAGGILRISVTGVAATAIRWTATARIARSTG
jgi:hypothetical protein